ncbi:hypothetical protein [Demequina lutea]|uniref:Uncharacterized protein n=1 Tax=Demequina lutea TaxID=431489 RepID=A0A7Y9ZBZ1_9MICO|nr:hypothetical protein [Demequina lutea]NYI41363.1 hypothetical protein [Demequina lutea]
MRDCPDAVAKVVAAFVEAAESALGLGVAVTEPLVDVLLVDVLLEVAAGGVTMEGDPDAIDMIVTPLVVARSATTRRNEAASSVVGTCTETSFSLARVASRLSN